MTEQRTHDLELVSQRSNDKIRPLSDAELDIVVGGRGDKPRYYATPSPDSAPTFIPYVGSF